MSKDFDPLNCVCCGEPNQTGRYEGLPVCFPCYQTGLLAEWIAANKPELMKDQP